MKDWRPSDQESGLTIERLKELISYDPLTGAFSRLRSSQRRRLGRAGAYGGRYVAIEVDGRRYRAHRLAWLYMTGSWPAAEIDHANGDKHDNRFCNLREATRSQQTVNRALRADSRVGLKGCYFDKKRQKWRAAAKKNGKAHCSGYFATKEEAHEAYCRISAELHGEFARSA